MSLGYKVDWITTELERQRGTLKDRRSRIDIKGHRHLKGVDVAPFRRKIFERSGGFCEILHDGKRCYKPIEWDTFEMHHDPDGYERYDSMESCFAACRESHKAQHPQVELKSIPGIPNNAKAQE